MYALSLVICFALALCGEAFADARSDCFSNQDQDASIRGCTLIIEGQVAGNTSLAYHYRGLAYSGKRDYDRAVSDYDQVIRLDPKSINVYYNRGFAYDSKGDYGRAVADYDQYIRLSPEDPDGYYHRGNAYYNKGDYDRAISDYDQAVRLKPDYAFAYHYRGLAYSAKRDYDRAVSDYDRVVRLDPKSINIYYNRGIAYDGKGDYDHAVSDYDQYIRLNPEDPDGFSHRGDAHYNKGDYDLAVADYNQALRLKPDLADAARFREIALAKIKEKAPTDAALPPRNLLVAERRVALVIGNSAYNSVSALPNPKNDATAVSAELKRLGFEVIEKHDLGVAGMRRALGEFEDKATGADWALVYYAGHGMELAGQNWLIPTDAVLARSSDAADEAVPLDRILERVRAAKKLRMVFLDACRNNPFLSRMVMTGGRTRSVERGLARVEPENGEVVFYAARDGSVASDGAGEHSPFTAALLKHMSEDGVELGRFFRRVTSTVLSSTNPQQEPFVYGRLPDEDFYFKQK